MDLTKLMCDVDYQKAYTYDQRADLFNKYQIPTSNKFLVPIWELSQFIISTNKNNSKNFDSFGHGQNVLNRNLTKDISNNDNIRIKYVESSKRIIIRNYHANEKTHPIIKKYRTAIIFDLDSRTLEFTKWVLMFGNFQIDRDMYDKIDQWLIDFGYEKW